MVYWSGAWQVTCIVGQKASIFSEEGWSVAKHFWSDSLSSLATNFKLSSVFFSIVMLLFIVLYCWINIASLVHNLYLSAVICNCLQEDALEYLCDFKVPVARALWFLKLVAVGQGIASNVNKQKKSTNDQLASGRFLISIFESLQI